MKSAHIGLIYLTITNDILTKQKLPTLKLFSMTIVNFTRLNTLFGRLSRILSVIKTLRSNVRCLRKTPLKWFMLFFYFTNLKFQDLTSKFNIQAVRKLWVKLSDLILKLIVFC